MIIEIYTVIATSSYFLKIHQNSTEIMIKNLLFLTSADVFFTYVPIVSISWLSSADWCKFQNNQSIDIVKKLVYEMFLKRPFKFFNENFRTLYIGANVPKSDIKRLLSQYKSGSVTLVKQQNGIAHIILDNLDRRNAISGKRNII